MKLLGALHSAIHGDPGHHLRMREVLGRTPHLPEAVIGPSPDLRDMLDEGALQMPRLDALLHPADACLVQCIHHPALDSELELPVGAFPVPPGPRALEAGRHWDSPSPR